MRTLIGSILLGFVFLTGCVPNLVSVSRDGTIALTLTRNGNYDLIQEGGDQVYLTNANADFLEKVDGMDNCWSPAISPSGRYIVACTDEQQAEGEEGMESLDIFVLYDREAGTLRAIYRPAAPYDEVNFPAWSPDERKIAFFEGEIGIPDLALKVYDVKRREVTVLDRRAAPQAAWLPDSERLAYLSLPRKAPDSDDLPSFHLKIIDVTTGEKRTLARRCLFAYSKIAVFPHGKDILFPCVDWEDLELGRGGVRAPLVLNKEQLPARREEARRRATEEAEEEETESREDPETKPDTEGADSEAIEEDEEEDFDLRRGQPFHPYICSISPDGERIAYARPVWAIGGVAEPQEHDEEEIEGEQPMEEEPKEELEEEYRENPEPEAWEVCVAKANGTASVVVARSAEEDGFAQVLWVSNRRLICVGGDIIIAVDADGKNKLDLLETLRRKFADQFEEEPEKEEETMEPDEQAVQQ